MRRIKPKTIRRLILLVAVLVIGAVSIVGFVWVRSWQISRRYERARADGMAAFARADYLMALENLARYLHREHDDAGALIAYAGSREHIFEKDGRHLVEAMHFYERALVLEPQNQEAGGALLRLYRLLKRHPEARDLAARLRPSRIEDALAAHRLALEAEFGALAGLKDRGERLDRVLARLLELRVFVKDAYIPHAVSLVREGRSADAVAFARTVAAALPDDPWSRLLTLVVESGGAQDTQAMFSGLCALAGLDERSPGTGAQASLPDARFVLQVTAFFDALARPDHSFATLRSGAGLFDDAELTATVVRRSWVRGQTDEVLARTEQFGAAGWDFRTDLLAFRALALIDLGRREEAGAVAEALAGVRGDYRAGAWSRAVEVVLEPGALATADGLATLRAAARDHPGEPVIEFLTGESLSRLGRTDEAREAWLNAMRSPLAIGWAAPAIRAAQTFLAEGRIAEAADASLAALTVAPTSTVAVVSWIETETAATRHGMRTLAHAADLESRVKSLSDSIQPDGSQGARDLHERLLLCRIGLQARLDRTREAAALAEGSLRATPPPSLPFLVQLARLSAEDRLGVSEECLALCESVHGLHPEVALAAALERHASGAPGNSLDALERAAAAAPVDERLAWELARVRFLETTGDPGVASAWKTLVERRDDSADVLRAFLGSPSSAVDLGLVERVSARLAELTGSAGDAPSALVRMARARALLGPDTTKRRHEEAVSILHALTAQAPGLFDARELLAQALMRHDPERGIEPDFPAALAQLRALATSAPESWRYRIRAARLLQQRREFDRAREELGMVLSDAGAPDLARGEAAMMLMNQADFAAAAGALERLVAAQGLQPDARWPLALGRCYLALGRTGEAAAVYRSASERAMTDPDEIVEVATGLDRTNQAARASEVMERLLALEIPAARRELARGEYAERRSDLHAAETAYAAATRSDPHNAEAWSRLVSLLIAANRLDEAHQQLALALQTLPDDAGLRLLQQRAEITGRSDAEINLRALADALVLDPARQRDAQAVRAIDALTARGGLEDPVELMRLAADFEDVLPVQGFAARRLLALPRPDFDRASQIAMKCLVQFPSSPEAARLAVEVASTCRRWPDMLDAARAWRVRDPDVPLAADLAVAEALHRMGRHQQAVDTVRARLPEATSQPSGPYHLALIDIYARSMMALGRHDEAFGALAPHLENAPELRRRVWIPVGAGAAGTAAVAAQWLERARQSLATDMPDDHASLALAYLALADRFPGEADRFLSDASDVLEPFHSGSTTATVSTWEALGAVRVRQNRPQEAIAAFRSALALDSRSASAASRLCSVLVASGLADDAIRTAELLLVARGEADAPAQMILGQTCDAAALKSGNREELLRRALSSYQRAAALEPGLIDAYLHGAGAATLLSDYAAALDLYESALSLRLPSAEVEATILNNWAFTAFRAGGSVDLLARARDRARRAADLAPAAPHLDTLGHLEASLGNRREAMDSFRRALALEPEHPSALIGLAQILGAGGPDERSEARSLITGLQRQIDAGTVELNPELLSDFERVKGALGFR